MATSMIKGGETTVTYTGTATTGSFVSGRAYVNGHTGQIELTVKSPSTSTAAGGNIFVGRISGTLLPKHTMRVFNFMGSALLIGAIAPDGAFTIRVIGSSYPASTEITMFGTALF